MTNDKKRSVKNINNDRESDTFLYFGYGSNLLTERIHFQNPSAKAIGNAKLDDYKLEFRLTSKVYF